MSGAVVKLDRRAFLRAGLAAAGGLTLGFELNAVAAANATQPFAPNAFVRIGVDDSVTVIVKHIEFGQGTFTGLPTLVAEELDADWAQLRIEGAPADAARYNNLSWGASQGTGGSSSMRNSYTQMREAGATARAMLVAAAAAEWQVEPAGITVSRGRIRHAASAREAGFGAFAERAAALPVPPGVTLKEARDFVYIGQHVPRSDSPAKTNGTAMYTQDFSVPGMLTALIQHPPRFGAAVATVDGAAALRVAGVRRVIELPDGVAVVARDFWSAKSGREALQVQWNEDAAFALGSEDIQAQYRKLALQPGTSARADGDAAGVIAAAAKRLEVEYEMPFLAHATMEPMNCVARFADGACELWYGAQGQSLDQRNVAAALGLQPEQVRIHMLYAGGSFGRRSHTHSDYVVQAARIAQALGDGTAVKLVWTREDDMRAGAYRPYGLHRLRGALDADGRIAAWDQRIVTQSILAGTGFSPKAGALDRTTHEGASDLPYAIPDISVDVHQVALGVPVLWWRSVGHTHTAFTTESFIDELAHLAGKDPLAFRLELLAGDPRRRAVLERAAEAANWATPLPPGRGRGIAVHKSFGTYVAEVVEVTVKANDEFTVDRVIVAVDCGLAVNPDIVRAQMEGGVGYALSAALSGAITFVAGRVQEDNFDTYPVLRLSQMPAVDVHIIASEEPPSGVGEPGVPPLAPALANALFAATGRRRRTLPLLASEVA